MKHRDPRPKPDPANVGSYLLTLIPYKERSIRVYLKGGKPYAIPAGASVHKYGGLGYVGFAEEVRAQEAELN